MPSKRNSELEISHWKSFRIRQIRLEDYSKVLNHVREFFIKEEPTCKLLGFSEDFASQILLVVEKMLDDGLSFLAENVETKELAAVRITFRQTKNSRFTEIIAQSQMNWKTNVFFNLIDLTEEQKKCLMEEFAVEEYAEFFIVATDTKYRNQGLSLQLYQKSLQFLKSQKFKLVKCIFTNPTTRNAAMKLGFKEFHKIDYKSLEHENGKPIFQQDRLEGEHFAVVSLKEL